MPWSNIFSNFGSLHFYGPKESWTLKVNQEKGRTVEVNQEKSRIVKVNQEKSRTVYK